MAAWDITRLTGRCFGGLRLDPSPVPSQTPEDVLLIGLASGTNLKADRAQVFPPSLTPRELAAFARGCCGKTEESPLPDPFKTLEMGYRIEDCFLREDFLSLSLPPRWEAWVKPRLLFHSA